MIGATLAVAALAVVAGVAGAAATVRGIRGFHRLRAGLHRERVLGQAATALISAADRPAVRDAALEAAMALLPGARRAWRVDGDPAGTVAQAVHSSDLPTFLDRLECALFPAGTGGTNILGGPSLLHATLGIPSSQVLVLIALPARGPAYEAAIVSADEAPSRAVQQSLDSVVAAANAALDRVAAGKVMLERRSERRLRLMLRYASDVICILDHDLTVVHVTSAVEPIVGAPAPELLGMGWLDLVAEADCSAARDLVTLAQGGRPARGEIRLRSDKGRERYVEAVVTEEAVVTPEPAADTAAGTATDEGGTPVATVTGAGGDTSTGTGTAAAPAGEPVDGYDGFSIAQLRGRLRGYALSTVEELLAYEQATRAREPYLRMLRNRLERLTAEAVESSPLAPRGA